MLKDDFSSFMGTRRTKLQDLPYSWGMYWHHYYGEGFMDDFGTLIEYWSCH